MKIFELALKNILNKLQKMCKPYSRFQNSLWPVHSDKDTQISAIQTKRQQVTIMKIFSVLEALTVNRNQIGLTCSFIYTSFLSIIRN